MAVYGAERRGGQQSAKKKSHFTMKMTAFAVSQIYSYVFLSLQAHSGLMKPSSDLLPLQNPNNMQ